MHKAILRPTSEICDPQRCSTGEAIRAAKERARLDCTYDLEIGHFLTSQCLARNLDLKSVERTLEVLRAISSAGRLASVLRSCMTQDHSQVRSKAALILAPHFEGVPVLEKLATSDADPRVRANTVEALWGRNTPQAETLFCKALKDVHHRVSANAAYGLYLIDPARYAAVVETFAAHALPEWRMTAAWLMRKMGPGKHCEPLKNLIRDTHAGVRRAAFQTVAALRASAAPAERRAEIAT